MSWNRRSPSLQGWIGCAPHGAQAVWAHVQRQPDERPAVRWVAQHAWHDEAAARDTLRQLRRQRSAAGRRVLLLPRGDYRLTTLDAPPELPREEWAAAARWQIQDAVDFPVDMAAVDVLAVPEGTSYRAHRQMIAVAAPEAAVRPAVALAHHAGMPWSAVDVPECALRNLGALVEPEGRAQALMHCQDGHSTLVVTWQGDLLATRQLEISLHELAAEHDGQHRPAYDQVVLELQRTLDGVERSFGQVTLARLLITPMPGLEPLVQHLRPLLYVPVEPFEAELALDLAAVPELVGDAHLLNRSLCAIGAALRAD